MNDGQPHNDSSEGIKPFKDIFEIWKTNQEIAKPDINKYLKFSPAYFISLAVKRIEEEKENDFAIVTSQISQLIHYFCINLYNSRGDWFGNYDSSITNREEIKTMLINRISYQIISQTVNTAFGDLSLIIRDIVSLDDDIAFHIISEISHQIESIPVLNTPIIKFWLGLLVKLQTYLNDQSPKSEINNFNIINSFYIVAGQASITNDINLMCTEGILDSLEYSEKLLREPNFYNEIVQVAIKMLNIGEADISVKAYSILFQLINVKYYNQFTGFIQDLFIATMKDIDKLFVVYYPVQIWEIIANIEYSIIQSKRHNFILGSIKYLVPKFLDMLLLTSSDDYSVIMHSADDSDKEIHPDKYFHSNEQIGEYSVDEAYLIAVSCLKKFILTEPNDMMPIMINYYKLHKSDAKYNSRYAAMLALSCILDCYQEKEIYALINEEFNELCDIAQSNNDRSKQIATYILGEIISYHSQSLSSSNMEQLLNIISLNIDSHAAISENCYIILQKWIPLKESEMNIDLFIKIHTIIQQVFNKENIDRKETEEIIKAYELLLIYSSDQCIDYIQNTILQEIIDEIKISQSYNTKVARLIYLIPIILEKIPYKQNRAFLSVIEKMFNWLSEEKSVENDYYEELLYAFSSLTYVFSAESNDSETNRVLYLQANTLMNLATKFYQYHSPSVFHITCKIIGDLFTVAPDAFSDSSSTIITMLLKDIDTNGSLELLLIPHVIETISTIVMSLNNMMVTYRDDIFHRITQISFVPLDLSTENGLELGTSIFESVIKCYYSLLSCGAFDNIKLYVSNTYCKIILFLKRIYSTNLMSDVIIEYAVRILYEIVEIMGASVFVMLRQPEISYILQCASQYDNVIAKSAIRIGNIIQNYQ